MSDQRITVRDRVQALERLNAVAWELNQVATWLAQAGIETEADMINQAAKDLLASCWLLERPIRARPAPERWSQPQQAVNGYRGG